MSNKFTHKLSDLVGRYEKPLVALEWSHEMENRSEGRDYEIIATPCGEYIDDVLLPAGIFHAIELGLTLRGLQ